MVRRVLSDEEGGYRSTGCSPSLSIRLSSTFACVCMEVPSRAPWGFPSEATSAYSRCGLPPFFLEGPDIRANNAFTSRPDRELS